MLDGCCSPKNSDTTEQISSQEQQRLEAEQTKQGSCHCGCGGRGRGRKARGQMGTTPQGRQELGLRSVFKNGK